MFKVSSYTKDLFREIWGNKSRFLSIFAIVALGTGFFAGLKSTGPDMKLTAQKYFSDYNLMDVQLKSTMGFTNDDIHYLSELDYIQEFQPSYSLDAFIENSNNTEDIVKVYSLNLNTLNNYISKPVLQEGRFPRNSNECIIDSSSLGENKYTIGSTVNLAFDSNQGDISDALKVDTFTIVGIISSPMYISFEKGSTSIGNGEIDNIMYISQDAFNYDVFTDIFITFTNADNYNFYDPLYEDLVEDNITKLESVGIERSDIRYNEIFSDANAKIEKAQEEIDDGWNKYYQGKNKYESQISIAKQQIESAKSQLALSKKNYEDSLLLFQEGKKQLQQSESELTSLQSSIDLLTSQLNAIENILLSIDILSLPDELIMSPDIIEDINLSSLPETFVDYINVAHPLSTDELLQQILSLNTDKKQIFFNIINNSDTYLSLSTENKELISSLEILLAIDIHANNRTEFLTQLNEYINKGKQQLNILQQQLELGYNEFNASKQLLEEKEIELNNAKLQLDKGYSGLTSNENKLNTQIQIGQKQLDNTFNQLKDVQNELDKSKNEVNELSVPKWYIFTRDDNPGYSGFAEDADRVDKITIVFPAFFILVAALVCLTTMARMIEEQRMKIGTYRALGYSNFQIIKFYLLYSSAASLLGSIFGLLIGFKLFPTVIFNAYKIMYVMPDIIAPFRWDYAVFCSLTAILCTTLTAYFSCRKELLTSPASLMRPKTPKAGKRIILEKASFIWDKLGFLRKVTLRNMFRYKKRLFMTIIGIAGCTALMLTGFGLQYSISSIVEKQYEDIYVYDLAAVLDDSMSAKEMNTLTNTLNNNKILTDYIYVQQKSVTVSNDHLQKDVSLLVPERNNLSNFIKLQNRLSKEKLELDDNGCIITEKISKLLNVQVGDTISIDLNNGTQIDSTINGITENYTLNYIYMSKKAYTNKTGSPTYNAFLAVMSNPDLNNKLSKELLTNNDILNISYTSENSSRFRDIIGNLNYIVLVIIFSAGALAFTVLYNLININVNERHRELATIKVLGFYDREVSSYIYKENTLSCLIGIIIGLFLGIPLDHFVISSAEVDAVMFTPGINLLSFIYAGTFTFIFNMIVNFAVYFKLKKIDMVESLKSVE
jgi:putative ABC transport system permease protein